MRGQPQSSEGGHAQVKGRRVDPARNRLSIQARLIDLGHVVDERTANQVAARFEHGEPPTDDELHAALSDVQVREALRRSFA